MFYERPTFFHYHLKTGFITYNISKNNGLIPGRSRILPPIFAVLRNDRYYSVDFSSRVRKTCICTVGGYQISSITEPFKYALCPLKIRLCLINFLWYKTSFSKQQRINSACQESIKADPIFPVYILVYIDDGDIGNQYPALGRNRALSV